MDLGLLTVNAVLLFLLMMIRITGMLMAAPFFSQEGIPIQVQVGIALALSLVLFPVYSMNAPLPAQELWTFIWLGGQEFVIGMLLGFVANMFFSALQMAGNYVTTQMGLGMAQSIDPISNEQSPIMGQFYFILTLMIFLGLNIHHSLIIAVAKSFDAIPLASGLMNLPLVVARMTSMASEMFSLSVMVVLPLVGILLLEEIALAFTSKIMPQMNVFMVAMPLKILSAMVLFYMTVPYTAEAVTKAFDGLVRHLLMLYSA